MSPVKVTFYRAHLIKLNSVNIGSTSCKIPQLDLINNNNKK